MAYYPPGPPSSKPPRRRNTTLFWAVVTFVSLLLCSALALLVLITGGQLPRLSRGPSWTPPPAPSATAAPSPQPVVTSTPPTSPRHSFAVGDAVHNVSGGPVNLRQTPGYRNKTAGDVVAAIPHGSRGTVLDGPVLADGLQWWHVNFPGRGAGWMAGRSSSGRVLLDRVQD